MSDPTAPHGRDDAGQPLAPYGLKVDGTPKLSNRGRSASGTKRATSRAVPTAQVSNLSDNERKGMLLELADMLVISPLASMSLVPAVAGRLGKTQADALAGDAFILSQYLPGVADGLILLSKTKPKTLAWLDKAEQNAPYLVLASALLQVGKALADNHMNPDRTVADAGRALARMKMQRMAEAVNAQAAQMQATAQDRAYAQDPTINTPDFSDAD